MSVDPSLLRGPDRAATLAMLFVTAERRAAARLATGIADFFLDERDRLDEHARAAIGELIEASVSAIERDIASHAARLLTTRGAADVAARLAGGNGGVMGRLLGSGLLRDADLMGELIAQARIALIDAALVANRTPDTTPGLLARLADVADGVVRGRALAYMVAEGRRRLPPAERGAELPRHLYQRLAWWVAAALRERLGLAIDHADRALAEATERTLAAYDESARVEAAAGALAAAIDALPHERAPLLMDTLTEGRMTLFVAIFAHALGVENVEARALALDPDSDRLWLALRATGLERDEIARIGWTLSEADRARDVEALPDALETVTALAPEEAAAAVTPLTLHPSFREAVRALGRTAA